MRQDVGETLEVSRLELLRRANTYGDQEAWAAFQQGLEEAVPIWFYGHPGSEAACHVHSERHFVALAFERLRQAALQRQVTFQTLPKALLYLRARLCGAILEMQRASSRPKEVSLFWPEGSSAPDHINSSEGWEIFQTMHQNEREQHLASLLFHCGLSPREIMRGSLQEWRDVQQIHHLRCHLLKRLLHHTNPLSERLNRRKKGDDPWRPLPKYWVAESGLLVAKDPVNWGQGVKDEFVERPPGAIVLGGISVLLGVVGLLIFMVGRVQGL